MSNGYDCRRNHPLWYVSLELYNLIISIKVLESMNRMLMIEFWRTVYQN